MSTSNNDREVFKGKSFSELLAEIHYTSTERADTIHAIVKDLRQLVTGIEGAVVVAPIIKEYLDVLVRSDEHKVKIATIIQRVISAEAYQGTAGAGIEGMLSEAERKALMMAAVELDQELKLIDDNKRQVFASLPTTGSQA